jgi:hypothetical protein
MIAPGTAAITPAILWGRAVYNRFLRSPIRATRAIIAFNVPLLLTACIGPTTVAPSPLPKGPPIGNRGQVSSATPEGTLQLLSETMQVRCGERDELLRYLNDTSMAQRITVILRNTGEHCPVEIRARIGNTRRPLVRAAPGRVAGGTAEIQPRQEVVFEWACGERRSEDACTFDVQVFLHLAGR